MKLSEIKLGTVVSVKNVVSSATIIARRTGSRYADTLLAWNGYRSGDVHGWPIKEKLWFDQISEQYGDQSTWPSEYEFGYWVSSKDDTINEIPGKEVRNLHLGDIVNTQYIGAVNNGVVIGKHKSGDALIGWKEETCNGSDKSAIYDIERQAHADTVYLNDWESVKRTYIKAKWVSRAEVAEVLGSVPVNSETSKELELNLDFTNTNFTFDQNALEEIKRFADQIIVELDKSKISDPKIQSVDIGAFAEKIVRQSWTYDEVVMKRSKVNSSSSFGSMIKQDAGSAAYRIASTQITRGIKAAILTLMKNKGSTSSSLTALSEMLETEWGTSLLAYMMGIGLQQTSLIKDARMAKMAEEMRVHGMSIAGNTAFEGLMEYITPIITEALTGLSKPEVRIAIPTKVIELDESDLIEETNETLHLQGSQA